MRLSKSCVHVLAVHQRAYMSICGNARMFVRLRMREPVCVAYTKCGWWWAVVKGGKQRTLCMSGGYAALPCLQTLT